VAARSVAWLRCRLLAGIVGSNPAGAWMFVSCVLSGRVSASGWSLNQRNPTECGVSSECDREASKGKPWTGMESKRHRIKKEWVTYWLCGVEAGETAKQFLSESRNRQILWQSAFHCRILKSPRLVHIVATCIQSTHSTYFSVPTVCCHGQYRGTGDRFLAGQDVSLFPTCLWPANQPSIWYVTGSLLPGVRLPGCESDYWLSSHCKVKNVWSCTSTPYAPLQHVTHKYRFVGALVSNAVFVQTFLSTCFYSYGFVSVIFLSKSIFWAQVRLLETRMYLRIEDTSNNEQLFYWMCVWRGRPEPAWNRCDNIVVCSVTMRCSGIKFICKLLAFRFVPWPLQSVRQLVLYLLSAFYFWSFDLKCLSVNRLLCWWLITGEQ